MTAIPNPSTGGREWLPTLDVDDPVRHSRVTVLFRLLLVIPHVIVLWVLGIVAAVVLVIGWFGALFTGRLPGFATGYLSGYLAWQTRVEAYTMLLVDKYPPFAFDADDYPVRIGLRPGPLNRLAVLFRILLAIPAAIVQSVAAAGWWAVSVICWLVVLVLGRNPQPLFESSAAIVRYGMRFQAYTMMLSSAYPKRLFGEDDGVGSVQDAGVRTSSARPLFLSGNARLLLIAFIVIGVISSVFGSYGRNS